MPESPVKIVSRIICRVETVRTYTTRETGGSGPTTFTKTVTTETKRGPNGETITVTRQTFGGEGAAGDFDSEVFLFLNLNIVFISYELRFANDIYTVQLVTLMTKIYDFFSVFKKV